MTDPHRDRRQTVSEAAIQYAAVHGAGPASRKYPHQISTLNKKLRERGLGRGKVRGPQSSTELPKFFNEHGCEPWAQTSLDRCGYVSPEQVRRDAINEGITP